MVFLHFFPVFPLFFLSFSIHFHGPPYIRRFRFLLGRFVFTAPGPLAPVAPPPPPHRRPSAGVTVLLDAAPNSVKLGKTKTIATTERERERERETASKETTPPRKTGPTGRRRNKGTAPSQSLPNNTRFCVFRFLFYIFLKHNTETDQFRGAEPPRRRRWLAIGPVACLCVCVRVCECV